MIHGIVFPTPGIRPALIALHLATIDMFRPWAFDLVSAKGAQCLRFTGLDIFPMCGNDCHRCS